MLSAVRMPVTAAQYFAPPRGQRCRVAQRYPRLSKVQSVDQRMRLECGVGFRQLRTCRRTHPGQLCADFVAEVGDYYARGLPRFVDTSSYYAAFGER